MKIQNKLDPKYSVILFFVIALFIFIPMMLSNDIGDEEIIERLKGPLKPDDPELLNLIQQSFILPPPESPEKLNYREYPLESWHFIFKSLQLIYGDKENGFFVEAGALDGEYISNSLYLEHDLKWTGLLVEPDPESFDTLISRKRNVWTSKTCLSTKGYPYETVLGSFPRSDLGDISNGFKAVSGILEPSEHLKNIFVTYFNVQCLPISSILLAMGRNHVDLFSLDIEGSENGVLETFLWDKITVDVWIVEHKKKEGFKDISDPEFIKKFNSWGYDLVGYSDPPLDYIFVRRSSNIYEKVNKLTKKDWLPRKLLN